MSILFKKDGLVFSILRNDMRKFIVLGDYMSKTDTLVDLFSFKDRLPGVFSSYQIGYFTPEFTLIPAPLFSASNLADYAKFQFDVPEGHQLCYDELLAHSLVLVYSKPEKITTLLKDNFEGFTLKHAATYQIEYYLALYKNKPGQHVHVHFWQNQLELTVIENGKLLLYNSFHFKTDEDLLYFVLNVYEQLGLNPENVPLKIAGDLGKNQSGWELLRKYIRLVEEENRPANYQFSHQFNPLNNHMYNRIFQAATCAL